MDEASDDWTRRSAVLVEQSPGIPVLLIWARSSACSARSCLPVPSSGFGTAAGGRASSGTTRCFSCTMPAANAPTSASKTLRMLGHGFRALYPASRVGPSP